MERNILAGVEPFNRTISRSCYYNQLMSGLGALGINGSDLALCEFLYIDNNFKTNMFCQPDSVIVGKWLGYRIKHTNVNAEKLMKYIDAGCPVILGVDCFDLPWRTELYLNVHSNHFLLVYGYDVKTKEAHVVEHFFANSADFRKYVVPLEALLAANDKFRRLICTKRTASMVITPGKRSGRKDILAMICAGKEKLLKSRKNIQNNIFQANRMLSGGEESIKGNYILLKTFFEELKNSRSRLLCTRIMEIHAEMSAVLEELVSIYNMFAAMFFKMFKNADYAVTAERMDNIRRRLTRAAELESKFFEILAEVNAHE